MESKDEDKSFKDKEEERYKEKIVYKVIPVPYYYPVPVDAEWYHKSYERQFQPTETTTFPFVDPNVEHFVPPPPPGFPFARHHHPHYHFVYESASKRVSATSSPNSHTLPPSSASSPKMQLENGCHDKIPRVVKSNESYTNIQSNVTAMTTTNDKIDIEDNQRKSINNVPHHDVPIKSEDEDNDTIIINGENPRTVSTSTETEVEAIRDRKRYLMTFPYDQKKKPKVNGQSEDYGNQKPSSAEKVNELIVKPVSKESDFKQHEIRAFPPAHPAAHTIRYPVNHHQAVMSPAVPYVMVPMQPPAFLHPEIIHQPHFSATPHRHPYEDNSPSDLRDMKSESGGKSSEETDEANGDVRYHPNGRRARTVFTRQQLLTLNNVFEKHHFVSGERMSELSDQLGLDRKIVKIWFQNKRQYARKKGSLLEKEENYFEYPDRYSTGSAPPTMTMVNHTRAMDNLDYKISDESSCYKMTEPL